MSNTVRKENDWLLARTANPQMSVDNFEEVGLNATNTSLETEDTYAKSQTIQNMPEFLTNGVFDKNKFHAAYVEVQSSYNELAHDTYLNELNTAVNYYKDDIFAPKLNKEQSARRLAPETTVVKLINPMLKKHSNLYLGSVLDSDKSVAEIMQSNRILLNPEDIDYENGDFSKALWGASVNDISLQANPLEYFKSWGDIYVQAIWHEDGVHVDPTDGQIKLHHKGDPKMNQDGDYFYEKANGRDIYNEKVLSRWDYLTIDGTKANTFDFMDSDDKKKSWEGTLAREIFEIVPIFIPYVGAAYMTARLSLQAANVANTVAKMISDNFDLGWEWTTNFEGFNKSLELGTSEYSQSNTFTAENLISMAGLVATLLLEQRAIFRALTAATSWTKAGTNINNEKALKKLHALLTEQYLSKHTDARNINELVVLSNKYAESEIKALQKSAQTFGEEASRLYMTGFTAMDAYNEAKENGASDAEASFLTMGYTAAEYMILRTDIGKWIMPEQKMERIHMRNMVRVLAGATDKGGSKDKALSVNWAKKLIERGARACKADYEGVGTNPQWHDWVGAFASNALSEGIEETSEELAYDLVKSIGNGVASVLGSDTDFKPFDNGLDNYTLSFLGGFFGGGVALLDPSFRQALKVDHNMTYDHAFLEFVGMLGEGKGNDLRKMINKMPVYNQFLVKNNKNTPAVSMQEALGDVNSNMDTKSKLVLLELIDFCENVLNKHDVNISQSSLLSQAPYLRDLQTEALANSSFAAGYIKRFNKARTDLIEAEIKYRNLTNPENVADSLKPLYLDDHKLEIQDAKEALIKADEEVRKYLGNLKKKTGGEYMPILIRGVMKEMTPDYIRPYGATNKLLFAQLLYNQTYDKLTATLKADVDKQWEAYKNTDHLDNMIAMDAISHGMAKLVAPLLMDINKLYFDKLSKDLEKTRVMLGDQAQAIDILLDEGLLRSYIQNLEGRDTSDLDYNDLFFKYAERLLGKSEKEGGIDEFSLERALLTPFINFDDEFDPVRQKARDLLEYIELGKTEPNHEYNLQLLRKYISELYADTTSNKVEEFIKLGFINPEMRSLLINGLNKAIDYITGYDTKNDPEEETKKIARLKNLNELLKIIKELPTTPILSILDNFLLAISDSETATISLLAAKVDEILSTPDIGSITLDDGTTQLIDQALQVIEMFKALLIGAATDNVTLEDRFSLNAMINKLEQDYNIPLEKRSNLAELPVSVAAQIQQDIEPVTSKLALLRRINELNTGQKVKSLNQISINGYRILYNKFINKLLGHTIDKDKWNKDGALDKLNAALANLSLFQTTTPSYSKEAAKEFTKQRFMFEDALYDFFNANNDKTVKEKAELFKELIFDDAETQILSPDAKDLSDAQFMYWLMGVATSKGTTFANEYKQAFLQNPRIAPFASQEIEVRLAYSMLVNGDAMSEWVQALRPIIKDSSIAKYNAGTLSEDPGIGFNAAAPEDSSFMPRFFNTLLIEGIAGSGKTTGVLQVLVAMLRNNTTLKNAFLQNVWVASIADKDNVNESAAAKKIVSSIGLKDGEATTFTRRTLLKLITGNLYDISDLNVNKYGLVEYGDNYDFVDGIAKYRMGITDSNDNVPSLIIIDEIGRYTTDEVLLIDDYAKKHGILVIALGDLDLEITVATGQVEINGRKEGVASRLYRGNFIHGPKLGLSIRPENNLKAMNQRVILSILPLLQVLNLRDANQRASISLQGGLPLRWLQDDTGLYGDRPFFLYKEDELDDDLKEAIIHMYKTAGNENVGLYYVEEESVLKDFIETGSYKDDEGNEIFFKDHTDFFPNGSAQSGEGKYYIIEPNKFKDHKETETTWKSFYTGNTRATQGSIVFFNFSNTKMLGGAALLDADTGYDEESEAYIEFLKSNNFVKSIEATSKVNDVLTDTIIQAIANNTKDMIEAALPEKVDPVLYVKRQAKQEAPVEDNSVQGEEGNRVFADGPVEANVSEVHLDKIFDKSSGTPALNLITYTHFALETGLIKDGNGKFLFAPNFDVRIDSINGLLKLLYPDLNDPSTKLSRIDQLLDGNQDGIKRAISLLYDIKDIIIYNEGNLASLLSKLEDCFPRAISITDVRITYVKNNKLNTPDVNDPLAISKKEELLDISDLSTGDRTTEPNVAKLGVTIFTKTDTGLKASLFVPLTILPNVDTIMQSSEVQTNPNLASLRNLWTLVNENSSSIRERMQNFAATLRAKLASTDPADAQLAEIPGIKSFITLIDLFTQPAGSVYMFPSGGTAIADLFSPTGPYIDPYEKGKVNYTVSGFETKDKENLITKLSDLEELKLITVTKPQISYTGKIVGTNGATIQYAKPGKPFIIITDRKDLNREDVVDEYLKALNEAANQLLAGATLDLTTKVGGIPKALRRFKIIYSVPPTASIKDYTDYIIAKLNRTDTPEIGNDFSIFRILALLKDPNIDINTATDFSNYVLYEALRPVDRTTGNPLTEESNNYVKDWNAVFDIVKKFAILDKAAEAALEKGDILTAMNLLQQQMDLLKADVFHSSGQLELWGNKKAVVLAFANAYSLYTSDHRVIIPAPKQGEPSKQESLVALIEGAGLKSLYYNPKVDTLQITGNENKPIMQLQEIIINGDKKEYGVNGKIELTALRGNMIPVLDTLARRLGDTKDYNDYAVFTGQEIPNSNSNSNNGNPTHEDLVEKAIQNYINKQRYIKQSSPSYRHLLEVLKELDSEVDIKFDDISAKALSDHRIFLYDMEDNIIYIGKKGSRDGEDALKFIDADTGLVFVDDTNIPTFHIPMLKSEKVFDGVLNNDGSVTLTERSSGDNTESFDENVFKINLLNLLDSIDADPDAKAKILIIAALSNNEKTTRSKAILSLQKGTNNLVTQVILDIVTEFMANPENNTKKANLLYIIDSLINNTNDIEDLQSLLVLLQNLVDKDNQQEANSNGSCASFTLN